MNKVKDFIYLVTHHPVTMAAFGLACFALGAKLF